MTRLRFPGSRSQCLSPRGARLGRRVPPSETPPLRRIRSSRQASRGTRAWPKDECDRPRRAVYAPAVYAHRVERSPRDPAVPGRWRDVLLACRQRVIVTTRSPRCSCAPTRAHSLGACRPAACTNAAERTQTLRCWTGPGAPPSVKRSVISAGRPHVGQSTTAPENSSVLFGLWLFIVVSPPWVSSI